MNYNEIIEKLYMSDPAHVSNIAFWKVINFLKIGEVHYEERDGYNHLYIVHNNGVFFYYSWCEKDGEIIENDKDIIFTEEMIMSYDFAILNRTQYALLDFEHPKVVKSNPLIYVGNEINVREEVKNEFKVVPFDFENDFDEAADMINRCYDWANYTSESVRNIGKIPAFDSDLWIWIVEKETGRKAALGIADFYEPIKEGSLDWIQVDPHFNKRGIGIYLVETLIKSILEKEGSIRVTGVADEFYKKCGLITEETWYILDNKEI